MVIFGETQGIKMDFVAVDHLRRATVFIYVLNIFL